MEIEIYKYRNADRSYFLYAVVVPDGTMAREGNRALKILSKINLAHKRLWFHQLKMFTFTSQDLYTLHSTHIL